MPMMGNIDESEDIRDGTVESNDDVSTEAPERAVPQEGDQPTSGDGVSDEVEDALSGFPERTDDVAVDAVDATNRKDLTVGELGTTQDSGLLRHSASIYSQNSRTSGSSRRSSLELRKVPPHILLGPESSVQDDKPRHLIEKDSRREEVGVKAERFNILKRMCLKPQYSLRRQMMLSFGLVSAITILIVMAISVAVSVTTGNTVKFHARDILKTWARDKPSTSARYVAEAFTPKITVDLVQTLYEVTRDRFVGYPDHEGYDDDSNVPFFDVTTGRNVYPLNSTLLPLDWDVEANVNEDNYLLHVQNRWPWFSNKPKVSTASAFYGMQGICDPSASDPNDITHYPNCTEANNDIVTGGLVAPSPTNEKLARKAADFNPILKSLFESHQNVKELGIFFANSGAGSYVLFPHYAINGTSSYTSIGCEWMAAPNPFDPSKPIASQEEIHRCHPKGTQVPSREYNPMERRWCRDQALNPHKLHIDGPFIHAWSKDLWLMIAGRAVYDRITNKFIACILVEIEVHHLVELLEDVKISESSLVSLVRWDDNGTVVASPNWNTSLAKETTTVDNRELQLGVDKALFQEMKTLVDFAGRWDPGDVMEKYDKALHYGDGKLVTSYPVPPPPDYYDPRYFPEFMVILSLDEHYLFLPVYDVDEAVDMRMRDLIVVTLIVGFAGLAFIIIIIFAVSFCLTEPLQWMRSVAYQIAENFGDDIDHGIEYNRRESFGFKTELSDLVVEFQKMISCFSGEGTAKAVKLNNTEAINHFSLLNEFEDLYFSRQNPGFKFNYRDSSLVPEKNDSDAAIVNKDADAAPPCIPQRCHHGPNVHTSDESSTRTLESNVFSSPLFWWIVALVVTPLLATTITISAVVTWNISTQLPSLVSTVKEEFIELEMVSISTATKLRAIQASEKMGRALRNLHVLTRVAGWLLFGGLQRSTSFTEMTTAVEKCKNSVRARSCYYSQGMPCDCDWNDNHGEVCHNYDNDTRYLQKQFFAGQSQDAWPNGDRNSTSFPDVDHSPNTTAWWDDVAKVPGFENGPSAAGYDTTYDRLRVISALSVIQIPLYNYDTGKDKLLGTYVGFEADGMLIGYGGCAHTHGDFSFWESSDSNGASKLRPELCPIGKYGYDARCRQWYSNGKNVAKEKAAFVTPPYLFGDKYTTAQSCSSALVDPITQQHVGQTLVDFVPQSIMDSLLPANTKLTKRGFPILITVQDDIFGANTVVGPGFSLNSSQPIEEVVFSHGQFCDGCGFEKVVKSMRAGESGSKTFTDGSDEIVRISYAPITAKSFRPLNSSDFSSGVEEYDSIIYSLALAEPEGSLLESFQTIEDTIQRQVNISIGVLSASIAVATILVLSISSRLNVSLTAPIMKLLSLIRNINRLDITDDFPKIDNIGSHEVLVVYETFEMLFKVVRFANSAFFSGDLEEAYVVLVDALRLFRRLDNKKAIGIASNNLGNTMLTMYRTMEVSKEPAICGMSKEEIIKKGTAYFCKAIQLGEEAYDKFYEEEGWSPNCLAFMQHLSNRYFNRAIFLLTVRNDHKEPEEAEHLGFRDLEISKNMDVEVVDQFAEVGFTVNKAEHFELMLGRIRGVLTLLEMSYPDEWGVDDLINQAFLELKNALINPKADLFRDVGPAGRMQQLDAELIRYTKVKEDTTEGAKIGIRMLVEDEYIGHVAELRAVEALMDYLTVEGSSSPEARTPGTIKELRAYQESFQAEFVVTVVQQQEEKRHLMMLNKQVTNRESSTVPSERLSISLRESTRGDVTMEMF